MYAIDSSQFTDKKCYASAYHKTSFNYLAAMCAKLPHILTLKHKTAKCTKDNMYFCSCLASSLLGFQRKILCYLLLRHSVVPVFKMKHMLVIMAIPSVWFCSTIHRIIITISHISSTFKYVLIKHIFETNFSTVSFFFKS